MQIIKIVGLISLCLAVTSFVYGQNRYITAPEAKNHLGEKKTVCGKVVSTRFVSASKGQSDIS